MGFLFSRPLLSLRLLSVSLKSHDGFPLPTSDLSYSQIHPTLEFLELYRADETPRKFVKMLTFSSLRFCILASSQERLMIQGHRSHFKEQDWTQCCSEIKYLSCRQPAEIFKAEVSIADKKLDQAPSGPFQCYHSMPTLGHPQGCRCHPVHTHQVTLQQVLYLNDCTNQFMTW